MGGFAGCDVEFEFRLSTARADANPVPVFKVDFESVGLWQVDVFNLSASVRLFARHEVALRKHFDTRDFGEGSGTDFTKEVWGRVECVPLRPILCGTASQIY